MYICKFYGDFIYVINFYLHIYWEWIYVVIIYLPICNINDDITLNIGTYSIRLSLLFRVGFLQNIFPYLVFHVCLKCPFCSVWDVMRLMLDNFLCSPFILLIPSPPPLGMNTSTRHWSMERHWLTVLVLPLPVLVSQIKGSDAGWTLGYMLNLTNMIPAEAPDSPLLPYSGYVSLVTIMAILLFVLFILCLCPLWPRCSKQPEIV